MQIYRIENDASIFGVEAASFPNGVQQAWADLHKLLPTTTNRIFYGVSHGTEDGKIAYKACVKEAFANEAQSFGLASFVLPKGDYIGTTLHGFMKQLSKIGETFQALLARGDYDKNSACIEWYLNESDVVCMIRKSGSKPSDGQT